MYAALAIVFVINTLWSTWFAKHFLPSHEMYFNQNPHLLVYFPYDPAFNAIPASDIPNEHIKFIVPSNLAVWVFIHCTVCKTFSFLQLLYEFLFMWFCYNIVSAMKAVTMTLLPFAPPPNSQPLHDNLVSWITGRKDEFTLDLFFSGHTSTICIILLQYSQMYQKISFSNSHVGEVYMFFLGFLYTLCSVLQIGFLLIHARAHYGIDVFIAPIMTYFAFQVTKFLFTLFFFLDFEKQN